MASIRDVLEPDSASAPPESMASVSLAISMKRIADAVCGGHGNSSLAEAIQFAIQEAIFNATRR